MPSDDYDSNVSPLIAALEERGPRPAVMYFHQLQLGDRFTVEYVEISSSLLYQKVTRSQATEIYEGKVAPRVIDFGPRQRVRKVTV